MTKEEITKLFPYKIKVSLWDILFADKLDTKNCIGANTLKRFLHKEKIPYIFLTWGNSAGTFGLEGGQFFSVYSSHNLMDKKWYSLREVTLTVFAYDKASFNSVDSYQPHKSGHSWSDVVNNTEVKG